MRCLRPGMELVISPHKSVAELGVIGRAEDMHLVLDAERDATMAYLDEVVQEQGGRRGRAQVRMPTDGLTWAVSRHATTRAGDPQVHDHVLVANIVQMGDERGGWKGLDTGLLRDHLHAATAIGRMAAAAKAVELGYGIRPTPGRRAGSVAGPSPASQKRRGKSTPPGPPRSTPPSARRPPTGPGLSRPGPPGTEKAMIGSRTWCPVGATSWPVPVTHRSSSQPRWTEPGSSIDRLSKTSTTSPPSAVARWPSGRRKDLHPARRHRGGRPTCTDCLSRCWTRPWTGAFPRAAVPCLVAGAREPVWSAACVLEDERRIAELADVLTQREGPRVDESAADSAIRQVELSRGMRLTERQSEVAKSLLTSGHALDLVIGVAGSGKTSTLSAVREGFEAAGYHVIGAATSGQAAKALGQGAGVASRTVASLNWRLEHGRETLTPRHVLVLDEGAMSSDADVGKLLAAVEVSGAKLVAVGDYRQLGSVGPGGALEALASRHPDHVWALTDNLRQVDAGERHALDHLRAGHLPAALGWYAADGRVHPAPSREKAMYEMVKAWACDVADGRDALLVAYHRDAVERLNRAARAVSENLGQLSGPELEVPGGPALPGRGPDYHAFAWTRRGVDHFGARRRRRRRPRAQVARSRDAARGGAAYGAEYLGADKLDHAYATTAHRSQGSTVDVTYALEDGGGRELAYVAMSRARHESHIHVVAPSVAHAAERLAWGWGQERREAWALDHQATKSLAELNHQRVQLARSILPDHSGELADARRLLSLAEQDRRDLRQGTGRWAGTPAGHAAQAASSAALDYRRASEVAQDKSLGPWGRRKARREVRKTAERFNQTREAWKAVGEPYELSLGPHCQRLEADVARLERAQQARDQFLAKDPSALERLAELGRAVKAQENLERQRHWPVVHQRAQQHSFHQGHDLGRDRGLGMGL